MKYLLLFCLFIYPNISFAQKDSSGILNGNVLDDKNKPLQGATISLILLQDSSNKKMVLSDDAGSFTFTKIIDGYYRIRITHVNSTPKTIDSIHFRAERADFNLSDIVLRSKSSENLDELVIYAEKPLIQSKDGNITFNAGESALSAGSNANELLANVPLITKDPDGKILVRGKEPKILIDDKPVELNQQQLQDLLESLPGSSIEKIEVMTNPPPQFANEQGGVINITTKKGRVGKTGRINISAGTRGEASINGNFNYRKNKLSFGVNASGAFNRVKSDGYAIRQNFNASSIRTLETRNHSENQNLRPNFRANLDYEFNKRNSINVVAQFNHNSFDNTSGTDFLPSYQLSRRNITSIGESFNPNLSLTYTLRTKKPGEIIRLISNVNFSYNDNNRIFYQEYLNSDYTFNGRDSLQEQWNDNTTKGFNTRFSYDAPLKNKKSFISLGGFFNAFNSEITSDGTYKRFSDGKTVPLTALINSFKFHQDITNARGSLKQVWSKSFSSTAGLSAEKTSFYFKLRDKEGKTKNDYWSYLPFANLSKSWKETFNTTASYKRTIRRPGINELTPIVDSTDLFNLRSGNPLLKPSLTHNFDLVLGKTKKGFYANLGLGFNQVENVFNRIRGQVNDSITLTQLQNSSDKKEFEISTWNGITINKKSKVNFSASYTYNKFNGFDKEKLGFKDRGSFTSNLNSNYIFNDLYSVTGGFTYNRFANPQGSARSNISMNFGFQAKMLAKKMTLTLNAIDPFREQENRNLTYGKNFTIENFNATQSRNFRLTLGYNFASAPKKKTPLSEKDKQKLKAALEKAKT